MSASRGDNAAPGSIALELLASLSIQSIERVAVEVVAQTFSLDVEAPFLER